MNLNHLHYRFTLFFSIFCSLVVFCGCQNQSELDYGTFDDFLQRSSQAHKQSGDFGKFFVQQISRYGGHAVNDSPIPKLQGTWYFESDHEGFAVQLFDASFTEVRSFMQQVFGPPISATEPHGLYGAAQVGVAIQFNSNSSGVGFIVLEKQKRPKR